MVLQNHVILQPDTPARMHFVNYRIESRDITDPLTKQTKTLKALVFNVDELNGKPVQAVYSTISETHALQFKPYLDDKTFAQYDFTVVVTGSGFARQYSLKAEKRM